MDPKAERYSSYHSPDSRRSIGESPRGSNSPRNSGIRFSALTKVASFKKSAFGDAAGSLQESKVSRNAKNEELAQSWEGKVYQVDVGDKEKNDSNFILFDQLPPDVKILTMGCTHQSTFTLTTQGKLYSWGAPNDTLGRPVSNKLEAKKPDQIKELNDIVQIACGQDHILALDIQGCVYVWGSNQYGQLGLGQGILTCDKPTFLEFFEDSIAQIYAGPNCSFAVTKQGQLYSWGQNFYGQLGQIGSNIFTPQQVSITPWSKENDFAIVTGKAYIGYTYTTSSSTKLRASKVASSSEVKKMELRIKELEENIGNLVQLNSQLNEQLVGGRPNPKLERNFEEDTIIRQLKEDHKAANDELKITFQKIIYVEKEIEGLDDDLENIRSQLNEILIREDGLMDEIYHFENEISKKDKSQKAIRDLERQKKATEDLLKSNGQIKDVIQKKFNEREEKKQDLSTELDNLNKRHQKLKDRNEMLLMLIAERKATIAQGAFLENKNYILVLIRKLYTIFKQAKESTIEDIMKTMEKDKGLLDALYESNEQLIKFKKDVDVLKVNPNDALYDIVSKMLEMFQDNISTRIKMNDYSYTVLLHLNDKVNDPNYMKHTHKKKKIDYRQTWSKEGNVSNYKQKYTSDLRSSQVTSTISPTTKNSPNDTPKIQRKTVAGNQI